MITESALKEFKAESKKWLEDGLGFLTTPIKYVELLELTERLIAAEKDAARYRWLRDCKWNESNLCVVTEPKVSVKLGTDCPSSDRLDAAIDEAMQCNK